MLIFLALLGRVVIGDPGLLAPMLINSAAIQKKYTLGIIPHYIDHNHILLDKINIENSTIIDVLQDPIDTITQIAQCENIISSAMHGLIVADSLNIPNARMILSGELLGGDYKFNDYYSAYNLTDHLIFDMRKLDKFDEFDLSQIRDNYKITPEMVSTIQNALLDVFPYKF